MFGRIIRLLFLSIVFISGVLIGGIYTPEMTDYSNAVDDTNVDKQEVKPLRKKRQKKQRVV
ncbi:MAG: hypothetical protein KAT12_01335 [Gammaproteobacteria bacterium]|nr:hypothetical protein [Gammaproteobacteria bacterium]